MNPKDKHRRGEDSGQEATLLQDGIRPADVRRAAKGNAHSRKADVDPDALATVRELYERGWNEGDATVLERLAPDQAECVLELRRIRGAFPDLRLELGEIGQRGMDIMVQWTAHGTHQGALDDLEATGQRASVKGIARLRIEDGRITAIDSRWDENELRNQLARALDDHR